MPRPKLNNSVINNPAIKNLMVDLLLHNVICNVYAYIKCLMMDNGLTPSKDCIDNELRECLRCYSNEEDTLRELRRRYDVLMKVKRKLAELPDGVDFGTT